jgi:nucleotide-binding universal stress UspA family protein
MRIVVGVDGSEPSVGALRWAVDEARRRGATVEAVHVYHDDYALYAVPPFAVPAAPLPHEQMEALASSVLDHALGAVDTRNVTVERIVVRGSAARELIEVAKGAGLLVLGTHGRGGFAGMLLGSVSQHVAHHTPCPLVLVPADR